MEKHYFLGRVLRGASWGFSDRDYDLRVEGRRDGDPSYRSRNNGFRCVLAR